MLTYYKLLQIHSKTPSIILPTKLDNNTIFWGEIYRESSQNSTIIFQIYFLISSLYSLENKKNNCKCNTIEQWVHNKYDVVFTMIMANIFFLDSFKEEFFVIFEKTQRTYFALKRFLHICRFRTMKSKIDTDLCMNPIDITRKNTFTLVQNGAKYLFTTPDILKLTMTALMNAHDFFSEPRFPKNPYTNIPLTRTDMYNIYFHVIGTRFIVPPLLVECFLNHFELENFLIDNESKLRNLSIKNYVLNSPHTVLYIETMFRIRKYFKGKHDV